MGRICSTRFNLEDATTAELLRVRVNPITINLQMFSSQCRETFYFW